MMQYPWGKGTPKWTRDATANDSDKSFTVPAGKVWAIKYICSQLSTTATVGNRVLLTTISNGSALIWTTHVSGNIAASQHGLSNIVAANAVLSGNTTVRQLLSNAAAQANVNHQDTFPPEMYLPAGYIVRVYDSAAIDVAADDLTVVLHYVEYDA